MPDDTTIFEKSKGAVEKHGNKVFNGISAGLIVWLFATFTPKSEVEVVRGRMAEIWRAHMDEVQSREACDRACVERFTKLTLRADAQGFDHMPPYGILRMETMTNWPWMNPKFEAVPGHPENGWLIPNGVLVAHPASFLTNGFMEAKVAE